METGAVYAIKKNDSVVVIPETSYSSSARRKRSIASERVRPQTASFAIIGS